MADRKADIGTKVVSAVAAMAAAFVARMGVRRQRDAGVETLDQHVRLGMRQRITPYCWHAG